MLTVIGCVSLSKKPRKLLNNPAPRVRQLTVLSRENTHHQHQPSGFTPAVRRSTLRERVNLPESMDISRTIEGPTKPERFLFSSYPVRDPSALLQRTRKWPLHVDTTGYSSCSRRMEAEWEVLVLVVTLHQSGGSPSLLLGNKMGPKNPRYHTTDHLQ